jgi:hypothetical protein
LKKIAGKLGAWAIGVWLSPLQQNAKSEHFIIKLKSIELFTFNDAQLDVPILSIIIQ